MTATASHPALAQIRFAPLDTQVGPGERCTAVLLGVPSGATVAWSVEGAGFVAEDGLSGPSVALRFRPEVVELLAAVPAPVVRRIRAKVSLASTTRILEADVSVLALRIPSVLALFRNNGFSAADHGAALLVVPGNSSLSSITGVRSAVEQVHAAAQNLSAFGRFSALAGRLARLVTALQTHEHMKFVRTDAIANLNTITLIQRGVLANDIEAEDELSSLILLGPAARRARLFIRRDFDQTAGRLDVGVEDENIVLIANLDSTSPAAVPAGRAGVVVEPSGRKTFSNELSSLQLAKPAFRSTLSGEATLTIEDPNLGGSDTVDVEIGLAFNATHRILSVDSFPPVVGSAARVSLAGSATGTFDPATGAMTLNLRLALDTALGTAEIPFALTGTADLETGAITLTDSSFAEGAPIDGDPAQLTIAAVLDPIP
jgi:hypothetical protein